MTSFVKLPLGDHWEKQVRNFDKDELIAFMRELKRREKCLVSTIDFYEAIIGRAEDVLKFRKRKEININVGG